jgi:hypothetical protein
MAAELALGDMLPLDMAVPELGGKGSGKGSGSLDGGGGRAENATNEALGGVAERSKAAVLKTADGASRPGVRIPSPPPFSSMLPGSCGGRRGGPEGTAADTAGHEIWQTFGKRSGSGRPPGRQAILLPEDEGRHLRMRREEPHRVRRHASMCSTMTTTMSSMAPVASTASAPRAA